MNPNAKNNYINSLKTNQPSVFDAIGKNSQFSLGKANMNPFTPKPFTPAPPKVSTPWKAPTMQAWNPGQAMGQMNASQPSVNYNPTPPAPQQVPSTQPKKTFLDSIFKTFNSKGQAIQDNNIFGGTAQWKNNPSLVKGNNENLQNNNIFGGAASFQKNAGLNSGTPVAEASLDDTGGYSAVPGGEYDQTLAFGGGGMSGGQNGGFTDPFGADIGGSDEDELRRLFGDLNDSKDAYNQGQENISQKVIPLEDITGQQANMERVYGGTIQAKADRASTALDLYKTMHPEASTAGGFTLKDAQGNEIRYDATGNVIAGNASASNARNSEMAQEGLGVVDLLEKNIEGFNRAVGIGDIIPTVPGSKATDFKNNVSRLKSLLTLDNLKMLKGAMSDKDLAFLLSVGTSLNTNMSKEAFAAELTKIKEKLTLAASGGGGTTGGGFASGSSGGAWDF